MTTFLVRCAVRLAFLLAVMFSVPSFAQNTVKADQGKPGTQGAWPVKPVACSTNSVHATVNLSTASTAMTTSLTSRAYTVLCVSPETALSTTVVRCRADGVAPTTTAGSTGDAMVSGDCLIYTTPGNGGTDPIRCIATAAAYVTTYQCVP